ncbi:MAG TPA: magnesium and cobalt transport protein CorA [Rhodopirellula sp.]|nr:magnesium and cobalt transport protein CorA [Rhodopirellula sp.]
MFAKRRPEAGARPGTLILSSNSQPVELRVTLIYGKHQKVFSCRSVEELPSQLIEGQFMWIDVRGQGDGTVLQQLASRFRITPLAMEDLVNAPQRPKMELFEHQQLLIAHSVPAAGRDMTPSQLGIVFDKQVVLTFHEDCDHVLKPIHERLENPNARLRRKGPDYLVYAILDACVDGCYPVLENLGESIEQLEEQALRDPRPELLAQIHHTKNILVRLRRSIWPQREMVLSLLTVDSPFIDKSTEEYLRDTTDHCTQLSDVVDMYRESTSGLINTYMSAVAHRSNEIMKVLTLLTSVFVPPTFLAGVYGMNFTSMPELSMEGAYPAALTVMGMMIAGTLFYFYRRGWLSRAPIEHSTEQSATAERKPRRPSRRVVVQSSHSHNIRKVA